MNLTSLSSQVSFTVGNIIVFSIILVLVIIALLYLIIKLNKKISESKTTRYGFGGKSIYSALGVLFLAAVIPITVIFISNSTDIRRQASKISDVIININKVQTSSGSVYAFTAIPIFEDKPIESEYDLYWKIEGNQIDIDKTEMNKSDQNPSYFELELPQGDYKVKVEIVTKDNTKIIREKEFSVK